MPEQYGTIFPLLPLALVLPWDSARSNHSSEAFGCFWLSLPTARCFHHCFCMVRPETTAASSTLPGKARKGQRLWSLQPRNTHSSGLCQQMCFSLISLSGYDSLPSLGFFCLLKHWAA